MVRGRLSRLDFLSSEFSSNLEERIPDDGGCHCKQGQHYFRVFDDFPQRKPTEYFSDPDPHDSPSRFSVTAEGVTNPAIIPFLISRSSRKHRNEDDDDSNYC